MAKKLDAEQIERARHKSEKSSRKEEERKLIQETIAKNRSGERKGKVIMPERKEYAYQEASKVRVAAYCRVSTAEEAQLGSFEMQVQHFTSVIENNPNYELVKIYADEGVSGTSVTGRKGFQEMMTDAENGKIDLILTKSISRFGRNIVDILTALRKLSNLTPPVAVNFESEGINTSDHRPGNMEESTGTACLRAIQQTRQATRCHEEEIRGCKSEIRRPARIHAAGYGLDEGRTRYGHQNN